MDLRRQDIDPVGNSYYIEVIKTDKEDKNFVYYSYQFSLPSDEFKTAHGKTRYRSKIVSGSLKIDKKNGDVHTLEFAEGDDGNYAKRLVGINEALERR